MVPAGDAVQAKVVFFGPGFLGRDRLHWLHREFDWGGNLLTEARIGEGRAWTFVAEGPSFALAGRPLRLHCVAAVEAEPDLATLLRDVDAIYFVADARRPVDAQEALGRLDAALAAASRDRAQVPFACLLVNRGRDPATFERAYQALCPGRIAADEDGIDAAQAEVGARFVALGLLTGEIRKQASEQTTGQTSGQTSGR